MLFAIGQSNTDNGTVFGLVKKGEALIYEGKIEQAEEVLIRVKALANNDYEKALMLLLESGLAVEKREHVKQIKSLNAFINGGYDDIPDTLEARIFFYLGYLSEEEQDYSNCFRFYRAALDLYIKIGDKKQLAKLYNNLAGLYSVNQRLDLTVDYYQKSIDIKKEIGFVQGLGNSYNNLAFAKIELEDIDGAENDFLTAIGILDTLDYPSITFSYNGLGTVEYERGNYYKALEFAEIANELAAKYKREKYYLFCQRLYGKILFKLGRRSEAILALDSALRVSFTVKSMVWRSDIYEAFYDLYYEAGWYKTAADVAIKISQVNDSVYKANVRRELSRLQEEFENSELTKRVNSLEKERLQEKLRSEQKEGQRNIAIIVLVFIALLSAQIYWRYRQRKETMQFLEKEVEERTKELRAQNEEKSIMLSEIHHRVKNNLQLISSFLSLQRHLSSEKDKDQIIKEMRERVHLMGMIHEKLYQTEKFSDVGASSYLEDIAQFCYQSYREPGKNIPINIEIADVEIGITKLIPCGLIINEMISNAFKYAFEGREEGLLQVKMLNEKPGEVCLIVQDDGIGIQKELDFEELTSLGMNIITGLVDQLDAEMEIKSEGGTTFRICFNL